MKRLVIILSMLFVLFTPLVSYAGRISRDEMKFKLASITSQLLEEGKTLTNIRNDLAEIARSGDVYESRSISHIRESIYNTVLILGYEGQFNVVYGFMNTEEMALYDSIRISQIKRARRIISGKLKSIQNFYTYLENKAALHLADKVKDSMRSALELLDKNAGIFKPSD